MPNIYKEMLLAWADIDITHNTDSYQTILYEPIHDNSKLGNTHYTHLTKENMHLVRDIWNVGTDDFIDWVGCSTSRLFYFQIQQLHACFPQDWLNTLKTTDYCIFCNGIDSVLHAFIHCPKTKYFIKQIEVTFKNLFGKKFKLNAYRMIFGIKHKVGNYASNLGIFLWSKAIRVIWTTRRLLEEGKPCNEMELFKNLH